MENTAEMNEEILADVFMKIIEDSYLTTFAILHSQGKITNKIEQDFFNFAKRQEKCLLKKENIFP